MLEGFELTVSASNPGTLEGRGDWHDEEVTIRADIGSGADEPLATLAQLHREWPSWKAQLWQAVEEAASNPGYLRLLAITAYDEGYFEIEFSAPDVFGQAIALAVGTTEGGFEEVGIPG